MLNETQISAQARATLNENGFQSCPVPKEWKDKENAFLFEDIYSIVGIVIYATGEELIEDWSNAQAVLTRAISDALGRGEAKAAEGYLVLLTSGEVSETCTEVLAGIRYDTSRVRKIVATGDDLRVKSDVENALTPLLPLRIDETEEKPTSGLSQLADLLNTPVGATECLVEAYQEQTSLLEALYQYVEEQ